LQQKSNQHFIFRECVFVVLGVQRAMRARYTLICDLPRSTFFRVMS
jgi:hypothetical protein